MTARLEGRPLIAGTARGPLLMLDGGISFWGGVDPHSGRLTDPRHPKVGTSIGGTILAIPHAVGSSSSSAIMLELLRGGRAPAAVIMGRADAILTLGVVVASELGYGAIPVVEIGTEGWARLPDTGVAAVDADGLVTVRGG